MNPAKKRRIDQEESTDNLQLLLQIEATLADEVDALKFGAPVTHVYNPLRYASVTHQEYVRRYAQTPKEVIFIGMNPGPWGMCQTGIPFGLAEVVHDWLNISGQVNKPLKEHPQRPIVGLSSKRKEVSGDRVWGWIRQRWGTPENFFRHNYIHNYCPLAFMEASGRNRTPDQLRVQERQALLTVCDKALVQALQYFQPKVLVAIGKFALGRAQHALKHMQQQSSSREQAHNQGEKRARGARKIVPNSGSTRNEDGERETVAVAAGSAVAPAQIKAEVAEDIGSAEDIQEESAADRATSSLTQPFTICHILHPSPRSPAANRGWAPQAERQILEQLQDAHPDLDIVHVLLKPPASTL